MTAPSPRDTDQLLAAALGACRAAAAILRARFRDPALDVDTKPDGSPVTAADRAAEAAIRHALRREAPGFGFLGEEYGAEGPASARWVIDPIDGTKNFVAGIPVFGSLIALEIDGDTVLGVAHAPALRLGVADAGDSRDDDGETWWAARGAGAHAGRGTTVVGASRRRLRTSGATRIADAAIGHGGLRHFHEHGLWRRFSDVARDARRTRGFGDFLGHVLVAEGRLDAMVEPRLSWHDIAAPGLIVEEAGGAVVPLGVSLPRDEESGGVVSASTAALAAGLRAALL